VVDAELLAGVALEEAGRLDEAIALYRRVLAVRPDSARAWTNLGNAQGARAATPDAEKAYREALRLSPADPDALNNLAWLLLQDKQQLDEAEALAVRAVAIPGPDRFEALDTLARIRLARGRCREAAAAFAEALAADRLTEAARVQLQSGLGEAERACDRMESQ
jgi:tetratricopeptide (TPR) repeat protein